MLADQSSGKRACYVVVDKGTGVVAGSSSYGNLSEADRRLEIGWSWLGVDFQGKGVNRWVKYLLLRHAFDVLEAERVEFKTDVLNAQARAGLRNVGAFEEGVLRSFNPMPEGGGATPSTIRCSAPNGPRPGAARRPGKAVHPCA